MGRDKNFLKLAGVSLLERVTVECLAVAPTWVVCRPEQELPLSGLARVDDLVMPGIGGPLLGIVSGLAHVHRLGFRRALVTSGDDVAVQRSSLSARALALSVEPRDVVGVCVFADARRQPLASAVRVTAALALGEELLVRGEARARVWAEAFTPLQGARYGEVLDVDVPSDLERARARVEG